MPWGLQRWSKVGYPNGMERQAIAIRFSLPVASANSLHSLFKACAASAHDTKHYEIIITYANHYVRNYYIRVLQECRKRYSVVINQLFILKLLNTKLISLVFAHVTEYFIIFHDVSALII